jgi:hypothetical protein
MDKPEKASVPPEQNEGIKKDLEEQVSFDKMDDAEDMFVLVKERLLHVNDWHEVSESANTKFQIIDAHGHPVYRHAHKGDLISIDIPGPSSAAGNGKDWVKVEAIEYDDYPDDNKESLAMRLRPIPNPLAKDGSVAHFFTDDATSTFVIERDHNTLVARYYGRNEKPNLDTEKLVDKVRNTVVGVSAILGFSDAQWKGLLKGFLKTED